MGIPLFFPLLATAIAMEMCVAWVLVVAAGRPLRIQATRGVSSSIRLRWVCTAIPLATDDLFVSSKNKTFENRKFIEPLRE